MIIIKNVNYLGSKFKEQIWVKKEDIETMSYRPIEVGDENKESTKITMRNGESFSVLGHITPADLGLAYLIDKE